MKKEIAFSKLALKEYMAFKKAGVKNYEKINKLLKNILNEPFTGLGKLEKLKGRINTYSRRVNQKDRLVYEVKENTILILQCKGHYDDK